MSRSRRPAHHPPLRRMASVLFPLLVVVLVVPGRSVAADATDAFLRDVASTAASRRAALQHVEADVVVGITAPAWEGAGTCEGRLVARRPDALRLRGYAAVATVFDAVTDGQR